jgi:hypothetical protein
MPEHPVHGAVPYTKELLVDATADLQEVIDAYAALSASCSQSMEAYDNFRSCATDSEIGSAMYTPKRSQRVKNKRRNNRRKRK